MLKRWLSRLTRDSDGTWMIALGAIGASIGAYGFQVIGGRSLGADGFAPVAALWTTGFLVHTIVMLPVEQMITRTVTLSGGGTLSPHSRRQISVTLFLGGAVGTAIVTLVLSRFFNSELAFIAVMALLMTSRAAMTVARGVMAGRGRFWAYGTSMLLEGIALMGLGVIFLATDAGAAWFASAIAAAPLSLFFVRPYRINPETAAAPQAQTETKGLLELLVVAAALSQLILAGGPLVVGLVGGSAAEVSIYFITFTLLRGPITASYGLSTRFLAAMTTAINDGNGHTLHQWAVRLTAVGSVAVATAGVGAYFILPKLIQILYGSEFRPSPAVAALGGAGAVAALAILFVSQILIARGRTRGLAIGWLIAATVASVVLAVSGSDPLLRVATAFGAGELTAFALLATVAIRMGSQVPTEAQPAEPR